MALNAVRPSRLAAAAVLVVVLAGCASPASRVVDGSTLAVASTGEFTSYNEATALGAGQANAQLVAATNASFAYLDNRSRIVRDTSFGRYTLVSSDPLVVRYTITDGVRWSDGTAVDAADLLLNWAALSGALDDASFDSAAIRDDTGAVTSELPADIVYFDSEQSPSRPGMSLATTVPEVSDDLTSITVTFDEPFADWELAFPTAGLPAHVVAERALGGLQPDAAKRAVIDAIKNNDRAALSALASFWNTGFSAEAVSADPSLLVGDGPYVVTDVTPGVSVTLSASETYRGSRMPVTQEIVVWTIPDSRAQVQALDTGSVQVIAPEVSPPVAAALGSLSLAVVEGVGDEYVHLDLRFADSKNGTFDSQQLREAFLATIPRGQLTTQSLVAVRPDAPTRDSFVVRPDAPYYRTTVAGNGSAEFSAPDIDTAKALVADSGVASPQVCILFDPANPTRVAEFTLIQQSAAQAGFVVTDCSTAEWQAALTEDGNYDAVLTSSSVGAGTLDWIADRFGTAGALNTNGYLSKTVDALITELSTAPVSTRHTVVAQIDEQLWSDRYGVTLYQYPSLAAYDTTRVTGVSLSPAAPGVFWNVWNWAEPGR